MSALLLSLLWQPSCWGGCNRLDTHVYVRISLHSTVMAALRMYGKAVAFHQTPKLSTQHSTFHWIFRKFMFTLIYLYALNSKLCSRLFLPLKFYAESFR